MDRIYLVDFSLYVTRETFFANSVCFSARQSSEWKGLFSKERICSHGEREQILFFYRVDPFPEKICLKVYQFPLTLLSPNFRLHLSFAFLKQKQKQKQKKQQKKKQKTKKKKQQKTKLSIGKKFICKVERLNVKKRRSRWDGSLSASTLFTKTYYYRLWQRKSLISVSKQKNSDILPISTLDCLKRRLVPSCGCTFPSWWCQWGSSDSRLTEGQTLLLLFLCVLWSV